MSKIESIKLVVQSTAVPAIKAVVPLRSLTDLKVGTQLLIKVKS